MELYKEVENFHSEGARLAELLKDELDLPVKCIQYFAESDSMVVTIHSRDPYSEYKPTPETVDEEVRKNFPNVHWRVHNKWCVSKGVVGSIIIQLTKEIQ